MFCLVLFELITVNFLSYLLTCKTKKYIPSFAFSFPFSAFLTKQYITYKTRICLFSLCYAHLNQYQNLAHFILFLIVSQLIHANKLWVLANSDKWLNLLIYGLGNIFLGAHSIDLDNLAFTLVLLNNWHLLLIETGKSFA